MNINTLTNRIEEILIETHKTFDKYFFNNLFTRENFELDLIDIFARDENDFTQLNLLLGTFGTKVHQKETGSIYKLHEALPTSFGPLHFIKTRIRDVQKPFLGAPDFIVQNFAEFKKEFLEKENFTLIERPEYEMIELWDTDYKVLLYFPNSSIGKLYI